MKKKLIIFVSMIVTACTLCACGKEASEEYTTRQQDLISLGENMVTSTFVPMLTEFANDEYSLELLGELTNEEVEFQLLNNAGVYVDGYGFKGAVDSFQRALEQTGKIVQFGEIKTTVDGKELIVNIDLVGENKAAKAEIIISNDMFTTLKSASLNPVSSTSELMSKAALNTVLGIGTVFSVLLIIIAVIYCFSLIPMLQNFFKNRKVSGVDNAVALIEKQEENLDDTELVAVIAAAIATYEGTSTDGFVVRSIRRH